MARGFRRSRRGIRARLDEHERALLAHLLVEVRDLLDDESGVDADTDPLAAMIGISTSDSPPTDPALARLLPDAHRDDTEASAEFRRYTESGLRERKRAGLEVARRTLGRDGALLLTDDEAQSWVIALTDVRLVLASRMGLEKDEDHERIEALADAELDAAESAEPDELAAPEAAATEAARAMGGIAFMLAVYDFLTWLQESLVNALMEPLPPT